MSSMEWRMVRWIWHWNDSWQQEKKEQFQTAKQIMFPIAQHYTCLTSVCQHCTSEHVNVLKYAFNSEHLCINLQPHTTSLAPLISGGNMWPARYLDNDIWSMGLYIHTCYQSVFSLSRLCLHCDWISICKWVGWGWQTCQYCKGSYSTNWRYQFLITLR